MSEQTITVNVTRSDEWVKSRAIEVGRDVEESINVEVPVGALSAGVRRIFLRRGTPGHYHKYWDGFNRGAWGFGKIPVSVDGDAPTVQEIEAGIVAAQAQYVREQSEWETEQLRRKAEQEADLAAEAEQRERISQARQIMAKVIDGKDEEIDKLKTRLDLLSLALSRIKEDVIREALKMIREDRKASDLDDLEDRLEDASSYRIFCKDMDQD